MTRIRLSRRGRRNLPFYHILVMDQRQKRDGGFIEKIGYYNPLKKVENRKDKVVLQKERYEYWIKTGAQPSETVKKLVSLFQ